MARTIPCIHLEGPHISPEDGPRGAHPQAEVRPADIKAFDRIQRAAGGAIRYVTLAPETPGAVGFIRALRRRGVLVALGHHDASAAQIAAAVDAGASFCTHLGNGAAARIHRHHNPLWPQLADDRLSASLIADGHHLPAPMLKTFVRAKGPERVVLVSDCVPLLGLPPGAYDLFGQAVDLLPTGKVCLRGTELLAGSATPLLADVLHALRDAALSLAQAIDCATRIPARLLGVRRRYTLPAAGRRADFVAFTPGAGRGPMPRVDAVYIQGEDRGTGDTP